MRFVNAVIDSNDNNIFKAERAFCDASSTFVNQQFVKKDQNVFKFVFRSPFVTKLVKCLKLTHLKKSKYDIPVKSRNQNVAKYSI